jgi:5-hydroxyisourate hydrolase-like protein (transthyretin family)
MTKNPIIAASLNFLIWGLGYIYLGKRNPGYYLIPVWIAGLIIFALLYSPPSQSLIQGTVLDLNTKDPLADTQVDLYAYDENSSNSNLIRQTLTDNKGSYQFRNIDIGKYIIIFSKENYTSSSGFIDNSEKGYSYQLNPLLIPKEEIPIKTTYLIPEILILHRIGVILPENVEIFTWIFAIMISLAFALDAYREAKKKAT